VKGPKLYAMAWRNLWRNARRTILTLISIAFGVTLAVLATGMGDSNWTQMINLAARLGGGHVTLQHPEYLDTPTLSRTVQLDGLPALALQDPDVERVVARISGQLMLSTAGQSYGAGFVALDPAAEDVETFSIIEALHEGEMFDSATDSGVILGARLAENLDARLGKKVVFTLTDKEGEIVRDVARVRGIVKTGAPTVDGGLSIFAIDRMREVLGYGPNEVVQLGVFVNDQRRSGAVAQRLTGQIGSDVAALTWDTTQPDLASFIIMKVAGAVFMEIVIAILVAAGIFNTLFVSVMERTREFGIMMALGFSPGRLFRLVMLESLWLGLVGLVCAVLLTALPYWYMSTTGIDLSGMLGEGQSSEVAGVAMASKMYIRIFPENAMLIAGLALFATLLSGLYPALHAGRLEPVESIRLV